MLYMSTSIHFTSPLHPIHTHKHTYTHTLPIPSSKHILFLSWQLHPPPFIITGNLWHPISGESKALTKGRDKHISFQKHTHDTHTYAHTLTHTHTQSTQIACNGTHTHTHTHTHIHTHTHTPQKYKHTLHRFDGKSRKKMINRQAEEKR